MVHLAALSTIHQINGAGDTDAFVIPSSQTISSSNFASLARNAYNDEKRVKLSFMISFSTSQSNLWHGLP